LRQIEGLAQPQSDHQWYPAQTKAAALAQAGLTRINVSLDSLRPREIRAVDTPRPTRPRSASLEELRNYPTIHPIKVNAVAIRGYSEEEALDFVRPLLAAKAYVVRWIEFMPLRCRSDLGRKKIS